MRVKVAVFLSLTVALSLVGASSAAAAPTQVPNTTLSGDAAFLGPVWQVPANGITMGYRQFGHGPDLVMITGDTAPMSLWTTYLLQPLAKHFRVTIFDNRGVGYSSDDPSVPLSVPLMARDTAALIKQLGLRKPTVVGWSMGGEIAITMAALHLGTIGRIVTSGGDAGSTNTIPPPPGLIGELANPDNYTAALELMFPNTPAGQAAQGRFVQNFVTVPQEQVSAQTLARQAKAENDFLKSNLVWNRLNRIKVPALITNGALDPGVPVANARALKQHIKGARLSIYAGAAHGMMFQDADPFAAQVARFAGQT